jgi:hypothetical protein
VRSRLYPPPVGDYPPAPSSVPQPPAARPVSTAEAFNEWMLLYTENPNGFQSEFQAVGRFLEESRGDTPPSYGEICAAFLNGLKSKLALAGFLIIFSLLSLALPVHAQTYPDLGRALYAAGYTKTVWVNSFDPAQSYLAHGEFNPNATGEDRYGENIFGTAAVSFGPGGWVAHATIHNRYSFPIDGKVSADLYCSGCAFAHQGGSVAAMVPPCGPLAECSYDLSFPGVANAPGTWTATVYRHSEGSVCGGEESLDLTTGFNGSCHAALVKRFSVPVDYQFTAADGNDTNYAAKPGASTTVLCAEIKALCAAPTPPPDPGTPPVTPPPTDTCCAAGHCADCCHQLCPGGVWPPPVVPPVVIPPTAPACPDGLACRAACPPQTICDTCPPKTACPDPPKCPDAPACFQLGCMPPGDACVELGPGHHCPPPCPDRTCPSCAIHAPLLISARDQATINALAAGVRVKNPANLTSLGKLLKAHPWLLLP